MTETTSVSVSRPVAAPPEQVWALVSDLTRMGEWSPENDGGSWRKGATGPAVGACFRGRNSNGWHRWRTDTVVTECEPGRAFAFDVKAIGFTIATWRYELEPTPEGCVVTETWIDRRTAVPRTLGRPVSGISDRPVHNRAEIEATLANLAAAAESL